MKYTLKSLILTTTLVIALTFFSACGKEQAPEVFIKDTTLVPYLNFYNTTFERHYDAHLTVNMEVSKNLGTCTKPHRIVAYINAWEKVHLTERQKTVVMLHEFGHCDLKLGHDDSKFPDGCRVSIMATHVLGQYCIDLHWGEYISELKNKAKGK